MEKLLTRKEAAAVLGISLATLDSARSNGQVAFIQYVENGCVYFTESGLREYIARSTHRIKAQSTVGPATKPIRKRNEIRHP